MIVSFPTTTRILYAFTFLFNLVIPARFTKQKRLFAQESKTLKDCGRSSKMTPSRKWPIKCSMLYTADLKTVQYSRKLQH